MQRFWKQKETLDNKDSDIALAFLIVDLESQITNHNKSIADYQIRKQQA